MPFEKNSSSSNTIHYLIICALIYLFIIVVFFLISDELFGNSSFSNSNKIIGSTVIPCKKIHQQINTNEEKAVGLEAKKEGTESCLPIHDLAGLNNSIKLAESISLLAIFIAIVGVMLPLLSIFTIKHQRITIENKLKTSLDHEFQQLQDRFATESEKFLNEYEKKYWILEENINTRAEDLITRFPQRLIEVNELRIKYFDHLRRKITVTTNAHDEAEQLNSAFARTNQMESALLMICIGNIDKMQMGFDLIEDLIAPIDVSSNELYIKILKQVLRFFNQARIFNSDEKREILNDFLINTLNTALEDWINDVNQH